MATGPAPTAEPQPTRIGPYKILERLGEGGMGTVYLAEQKEPVRRRVALKLIKLGMDSKAVLARFELERQALAVMNHDAIAKVFDCGTSDRGQPFFVMELVEGIPITEFCDRHKLSLPERIDLFQQVCAGVQHAHQKGVLHRDLKPGNVLVARKDERHVAKIIDFGVARATDHQLVNQTIFTEQGVMIGTPEYMSPEQAMGESLHIDTRTDVYSLGVLLYEILVGELPFPVHELRQAGILEIQRKLREDEPQRPSTKLTTIGERATECAVRRRISVEALKRELKGDLDWVVLKAMAKEPERRYGSAAEVAADLLRYLEHQPVLAGPPSAAYRVRKFVRRYRVQVMAAAAVLLAIVAGGIGTLWYAFEAKRQEGIANDKAGEAREQVREASRSDFATAEDALAKGEWQKGLAYLGRALRYDPENRNAEDALWQALNCSRWEEGAMPLCVLQHVSTAHLSPDGRLVVTASQDGARVWDAATGQPIGPPMRHEGEVGSASFSDDAKCILTTGVDKTARVWDAATGRPIGTIMRLDEREWGATFSPDGTCVLTVREDTARVWDPAIGRPIGTSMRHDERVCCATFSPDGARVVTASGDAACIWDAVSGQLIGTPIRHEGGVNQGGVTSASFSPDGMRVVTASFDKTARVWNVGTGKAVGTPMRHEESVSRASFSPDGTRVITASRDNTARVWDAATGQPAGTPMRHEGDVESASFSPDGTRVVTASKDKTARVWDAGTGHPVGMTLRHEGVVWTASFNCDGTRVVTTGADKSARVWDVVRRPIGTPLWPLPFGSASFSPDGTRILTAGFDAARVWDATTGQPIGVPMRHEGRVGSASFSADGTRVVTAGGKTVRVWDATTGQPIGDPMPHEIMVMTAGFSPDGTRVVSASMDKTARMWDATTGQPIGTVMGHDQSVASATFSPDGTRVVTASMDKTARLWDAATGKPMGAAMQHPTCVQGATFSPDGRRVLTVMAFGHARLWDAATGQPIGDPMRHDLIQTASFSPDGRRVVTAASSDQTARVWDAATGQSIGTPMQHQGVTSATFSPDGTRVVTTGHDKTARVWDAATAQPIGTPMRHEDAVMSANFSPDGTRVVTGSKDGVRVWEVATRQRMTGGLAERLATLCAVARLDPELGTLIPVALPERLVELPKLEHDLADRGLSGWLFVLQCCKSPQPGTRCSLRSTATIREVATDLFTSGEAHYIREAAAVDPGNPLLPFAFAGLEEAAKDKQEANTQRACFLRAYGLARLPADAVLAAKAAEMLEKQKQPELAPQAWARAAEATPADTDAVALLALGLALRKIDRLPEALVVYSKSAQRFPKDAKLLTGFALTQWLANDRDAAVATFQRIIESNRQWAIPANLPALHGSVPAEFQNSARLLADKLTLQAVLAETIQRHPELAPATETNTTKPPGKR